MFVSITASSGSCTRPLSQHYLFLVVNRSNYVRCPIPSSPCNVYFDSRGYKKQNKKERIDSENRANQIKS